MSKGSNEEEYWQACVLLSAALIAVVISFSLPGHGVSAIVDGRRVLIGNRKLMRNRQIGITEVDSRAAKLQGAGRTVIMAAVDGRLEGAFAVADAVRPTSRKAVKRLSLWASKSPC